MFTHRAIETSRLSFRARSRFIVCGLGVGALAICLSPTAFATTYTAGSVNCTEVVPNGDGTLITNPSSSSPATFDSYNGYGGSDHAEEECVWSHFAPSGTKFATTASLNLSANADLTQPGGPIGPPQRATLSSAYGGLTFNTSNPQGSANASYTIPAETDISTIQVTGYAYAGDIDGAQSVLNVTKINITH